MTSRQIARIKAIETKIKEAFAPEYLKVIDESHLHVKHPGAKTHGGGHFKLKIKAKFLKNMSLIQKHQAIYRCLASMLQAEIHALSILVLNEEEKK